MSFDVDIAIRLPGRTARLRIEPASGLVALIGPSGIGKTTALKAIAGLVRPEQGKVAIAGRVLFDSAQGIDLPPERRRSGYIFQDMRLFPHMSVAANIDYAASPKRSPPIARDRLIDLLGLQDLLGRRPANLSGGEARRVAIARALLAGADFLLMDEPLASLDPARRSAIIAMIAALRDEARLPMLLVSHAADEIQQLASQIIELQ